MRPTATTFRFALAIAVLVSFLGACQRTAHTVPQIEGTWTLTMVRIQATADVDLMIPQSGTLTIGDGKISITYRPPLLKILESQEYTYVKDAAAMTLELTLVNAKVSGVTLEGAGSSDTWSYTVEKSKATLVYEGPTDVPQLGRVVNATTTFTLSR